VLKIVVLCQSMTDVVSYSLPEQYNLPTFKNGSYFAVNSCSSRQNCGNNADCDVSIGVGPLGSENHVVII